MIDTREVSGENTGGIAPVPTLEQVRERIGELNDSVLELQRDAEKLLTSARTRTIVALLDPPAPLPDAAEPVVDPASAEGMAFGVTPGVPDDETPEETAAQLVSELASEWELVDSDEAIEKFFSSDVEPEPARRWLLTD